MDETAIKTLRKHCDNLYEIIKELREKDASLAFRLRKEIKSLEFDLYLREQNLKYFKVQTVPISDDIFDV